MIGALGKLPTPVTREDDYLMLSRSGAGVNIYILDSGIRTRHSLFRGRAFNFKGMTRSPYIGLPINDVVGHGTHVAGIAGSLDFGVA
jgi:subtilisin family serine protease